MSLFSKNTPEKLLLKAIKNGELSTLKKIIKNETIDLNHKFDSFFEKECTALHYASKYGQVDIIEYLLELGADIDSRDYSYKTPLIYSVIYKNEEAVNTLLLNHADINAQDNKGKTAIFHALDNDAPYIAKKLLVSGIDLTIKDRSGNSALMIISNQDDILNLSWSKRVLIEYIENRLKAAKTSKPEKAQPIDREEWVKTGNDSISFIGKYPNLGYELSEVFNLRTRQQIIVRKDIETKAVTMSQPVSFNDIDRHVLEDVIAKFKRQGGRVNEEQALHGGNVITKKQIKKPL